MNSTEWWREQGLREARREIRKAIGKYISALRIIGVGAGITTCLDAADAIDKATRKPRAKP